MFDIDPAYSKVDIMESPMVRDVWRDKYRWGSEASLSDTFQRVAKAIYEKDPTHEKEAFEAMRQGLWIPGGRIVAGAGTAKRVTLMNCYVNETVVDSMEGIIKALSNTMLTLQQGGGIGTDFSTLRPEGAILRRTHTKASGPIPFMHTWDSASRTIRSAGDRRGAMMGTISDTHPDLPKFIMAKRTLGSLEQFNISVLVTDAFMEAIKEDNDWVLHFPVEPMSRPPKLAEEDFIDDKGVKQYAYSVWPARELWKLITTNTYEYSEPGVIFIDRVNALNNLHYVEEIRCTNPCGEQPLPPHGCCDLGHVNLAKCVVAPFTDDSHVDYDLIARVTRMGVRFLDNVIDYTAYPLDQQAQEQYSKRRLGLGYTGLADLLAMLGVRYGSPDAVRITEEITRHMCISAYEASIELAKEKGSFPLFDKSKYLSGFSFAHAVLPADMRARIAEHGIRNSLLMTLAPVGTGSIICGNVSSSGEPVFMHRTKRKILKSTSGFSDEREEYIEYGYSAKLYLALHPDVNDAHGDGLPAHMVTAGDLSVEEHIAMQAAAQRWVDSSISKTINVPKEMSYEQFVKVYDLAYTMGCKGCTTYRPSDLRGSVLSSPDEKPASTQAVALKSRPQELQGKTYKINWPSLTSAIYLTVNSDEAGEPFEVFLNSKDAKYHDWTTALTVMISAIFRAGGGDIDFVARELQQVQSLHDGTFKEGRHHPSLVAYIGFKLEQHISALRQGEGEGESLSASSIFANAIAPQQVTGTQSLTLAEKCPQCHEMSFMRQEGCKKCGSCGYTTCG